MLRAADVLRPIDVADWSMVDGDEYVEAVLRVVESIPAGRVLAYGEVARAVGRGGPRQVGRVLSLYGGGVPWWRVVTVTGRTPPGNEQAALEHLRAEGTPLRDDHVDMRIARGRGSSRPHRRPPRPRRRGPGRVDHEGLAVLPHR